jgi:insulysin
MVIVNMRRALLAALTAAALLLHISVAVGETVVKSPNDQRQYETFVLANQLKVLLISDPGTDKAAAALDVFVGSTSDPQRWPGLAHFLEHMLFLGTKKYPQAGDYQNFISKHGGRHNAYTGDENTNFFFDIDKDYLEPALDRFAQFFVAPLFTPQYVDRERHAVDSEFQTRRKSDGTRLFFVWKQVANPKNPLSRFDIGNLSTLVNHKDRKLREALVDFYQRHYSANIMTLVVLGKEPLPILKQWVVAKFSAVRNVDASTLRTDQALFASHTLPARLNVTPLKDKRVLVMTFPIPPVVEYYRSKPVQYIANLLGYEGKGSLLSLLKSKGWVETLSAGLAVDTLNNAAFSLSMGLTREGLQHVNDIPAYVFRYVELIRGQGIAKWIFEEQRKIADISFRFQEQTSAIRYVSALASNLQIYPPDLVLRGPYEMDQYDPKLILRFLERLTPDNMLLTVNARGLATDATERWFGTPYEITRISSSLIDQWDHPPAVAQLAIPAPNPFLPDDLAVKPPRDATAKPVRLLRKRGLQLWFKQDTTFKVPRADFYFSVRSPLANDNPTHSVLTKLYVKLVKDQLNEFTYPAYLAGLNYELYTHLRGFTVRISGFNDKQALLLSRVVAALAKPTIDPKRFAIIKDELTRDLENAKRDLPSRQTTSQVSELLLRPFWTEDQRLAALAHVSPDDLSRFVPQLLSHIYVVALAHGNLYRDDGLALTDVLQQRLIDPAAAADVPQAEVIKLPKGEEFVRQLKIDHPDSAITIYAQGPNRHYSTRAKTGLLTQILSAPFYDNLRTEEQLGYIVYATSMPILRVPGVAFVVQSPNTPPPGLEEKIDRFVATYADAVGHMSDQDLMKYKQGLLSQILQKDRNLRARSNRYWSDIDEKQYKFDERERLADAVRDIDKKALERYYHKLLLGKQRRRLVVSSSGTNHPGSTAARADTAGVIAIRDIATFKQHRSAFPR